MASLISPPDILILAYKNTHPLSYEGDEKVLEILKGKRINIILTIHKHIKENMYFCQWSLTEHLKIIDTRIEDIPAIEVDRLKRFCAEPNILFGLFERDVITIDESIDTSQERYWQLMRDWIFEGKK